MRPDRAAQVERDLANTVSLKGPSVHVVAIAVMPERDCASSSLCQNADALCQDADKTPKEVPDFTSEYFRID